MRTYEDILKDLEIAKKELAPVRQKAWELSQKVTEIEKELEKYKLDNKMYRPMSDLKEYAGKEIYSIILVVQNDDGTLCTEEMYNDELFDITKDGYLHYSSYNCGVMHYNDKKNIYEYWYHFGCQEKKFVGFIEIELEED